MYSYENTFNEKQANGILIFICSLWLIIGLISKNFQNIGILTGDSMVVDVRRAKKKKVTGYSKAAAEVCKHALKFGDLSAGKGKRLRFSRASV